MTARSDLYGEGTANVDLDEEKLKEVRLMSAYGLVEFLVIAIVVASRSSSSCSCCRCCCCSYGCCSFPRESRLFLHAHDARECNPLPHFDPPPGGGNQRGVLRTPASLISALERHPTTAFVRVGTHNNVKAITRTSVLLSLFF